MTKRTLREAIFETVRRRGDFKIVDGIVYARVDDETWSFTAPMKDPVRFTTPRDEPTNPDCTHEFWVEEFKIPGQGYGTIPICQECGVEL